MQSQAGDSEQVNCAWDHACLEILELLGLPGRARQRLKVETGEECRTDFQHGGVGKEGPYSPAL